MLTYIALLFVSLSAYAADMDPASQDALKKTQSMMKDPNQRNQMIQNDPQAKNLDASLDKLGPGVKDQLYDMASDLMQTVMKEANGDPEKMKKLLLEYQTNPAAFYQKMSPEQKQRVRDVAGQVEQNQPKGVRAGAR